MAKYLSCAETAKLMRLALKECFAGNKFSVRMRASGRSIAVRWTDGPAVAQVEAVLAGFEGSYFDGMIDYKGSKYHTLDGEEVRLGADFIFAEREYSDALIERAIQFLQVKYNAFDAEITVQAFRDGQLYNLSPLVNGVGNGDYWTWQNQIRQTLAKLGDRVYLKPGTKGSVMERLQPAGDDGYGAGTVGRNGKGGEQCYVGMEQARQKQRYAEMLDTLPPVGSVQ